MAFTKGPDELMLPVSGEVWEIDKGCLTVCDMIESNGSFYDRELRELKDGRTVWMYVMNDPYYMRIATICETTEQGEYLWS
jgi:gamma-glutamylcyclotransferase (GGCT)/AIG2-like uncharacterized protein YtfP